MAVTFNTEWTIERDEDDAFDVCIDYEFRAGHEVEITSVWRKADENDPNAPEFELTDDEREKIELWLLENPPEPDCPEDF